MIDITPLVSPSSAGIALLVEYLLRSNAKSAKNPKGNGPQDVATPQPFFDWLDRGVVPSKTWPWLDSPPAGYRFGFDLSAQAHNTKCPRYFSPEDDSLSQDWSKVCGINKEDYLLGFWAWNNPPYGRDAPKFAKKASEEVLKGARLVQLMKAAVGTRWFNKYVKGHPCKVIVLEGRVPFDGDYDGNSANFDSMLIEWNGGPFKIEFLDWKPLLAEWLVRQGLPAWPAPKKSGRAKA